MRTGTWWRSETPAAANGKEEKTGKGSVSKQQNTLVLSEGVGRWEIRRLEFIRRNCRRSQEEAASDQLSRRNIYGAKSFRIEKKEKTAQKNPTKNN